MSKIAQIQLILGVAPDGIWGAKSKAALEMLTAPSDSVWQSVTASSFADPADVAAFREAKANGATDQEAFRVGDNGIGFTGMDCADDKTCICALPPEIWKARWGNAANAAGRKVLVRYSGQSVEGAMGDTMPHIAHITNGARIDLNPGFARAFGIEPPFLIAVEWRWA